MRSIELQSIEEFDHDYKAWTRPKEDKGIEVDLRGFMTVLSRNYHSHTKKNHIVEIWNILEAF